MSKRSRFSWVLAFILATFWIVISSIYIPIEERGAIQAARIGFLAPDFSLKDINNSEISLSHYRGQVVLVNFWASWCPPCRYEMPAFQNIYSDYSDQDFVILAVNSTISDTVKDAMEFVNEQELTFPVLFDFTGEVNDAYQASTIPRSIIVDKSGVIRHILIGSQSETALRIKIYALLQEQP